MKTKIEIIDETIDYYSNNPRSLDKINQACLYKDDSGNFCAHSRCLRDDFRDQIAIEINNRSSASDLILSYGDDIHKEEYREHEPEFWNEIQILHDLDSHWEEIGSKNKLSKVGIDKVKYLKEKYK